MPWVVELNGRDLPGLSAVDETLRFAHGEGVATSDVGHIPSGLIGWRSATQRVEISETGTTRTGGDTGSIEIANVARRKSVAGPWDSLPDWAWRGRDAFLYWLPGTAWSGAVLSGRGVIELAVSSGDRIEFSLRDIRFGLDTPLQTLKYLGDNVAPNGVEGGADLKGQPQPIVEGVVSNVTVDLVNAQKLIFKLHDGYAAILCVRDGAVPLSAGSSRANVAALEANAPTAGTYDYVRSLTEGTLVRLGSATAFGLQCDISVGATEADRTHGQIWQRIREDRCGTTTIDTASVTALDAILDKEAGFRFTGETRREALDRVLSSASAFEVQDLAGDWKIRRLDAPSGSPVLSLVMVTKDSELTSTDRRLLGPPERAWPSYAPNGAPPYRVNVNWGYNYTTMSVVDFAGSAAPRLKEKFAKTWRVETDTDTAVWDPSDDSGAYPQAPELTIETGYQPGADGLTCPHAAAEATDRLALYGAIPVKAQYQVSFAPEPGDEALPGDVIRLTHPRYSLDTGPLFICLQSSLVVESDQAVMSLILGLQT